MSPFRTIVAALGCCLLLAACASRPDEADLAQAILNATNGAGSSVSLSAEQANCIARELLASDLSDTTLSGLVENFDHPQVLETEAARVEPTVAAAATTCQ